MEMDAEVMAMGPFSGSIADCLEYRTEYYADVPAGTTVFSQLFCCVTSDQSRELAECFGVDPWDLSRHEVTLVQADFARLRDLAGDFEGGVEEVEQFRRLSEAGFRFWYRPCG